MAKKVKTKIKDDVTSKILEDIIKQMDKKIEQGCITRYDEIEDISAISTGNLSIDIALGVGGVPKGRIIEIFGPESSGKTTLALGVVAQAQKDEPNKVAAFIDMEHALNPSHAIGIGVDLDKLVFSQPTSAEKAMDLVYELAKRGDVSVIVVDSVAALVPQDIIDKDSGQMTVGLIARLLTTALLKLNPISAKTQTTIIFINQLRDKINTFGYGDKEGTPGGRALKFYSSIRMDLRKIGTLTKSGEKSDGEDSKDAVGQRVKVHIKKNKCAPPFKKTEVDLIFGRGFCYLTDVFNIAVKNDIIKKSGSWFVYEDEKIGHGKFPSLKNLKDNKDLFLKIEEQVKALIKESGEAVVEDEAADEEDILETAVFDEASGDDKGWK